MALLSHRINYDRRRLLTALLLSPLCCSAWAKIEIPPDLRRIVALEWLPAELLLALGVMPLGGLKSRITGYGLRSHNCPSR